MRTAPWPHCHCRQSLRMTVGVQLGGRNVTSPKMNGCGILPEQAAQAAGKWFLGMVAHGVMAALSPFARIALNSRAQRGKEDPGRLGERLGHAAKSRPAGPLAWLHGASMGEGLSLLPLAAHIAATRPATLV